MRRFSVVALVVLACGATFGSGEARPENPPAIRAPADGAREGQRAYRGAWKTTNRKLDGAMTCVVTPMPDQQWRGRFYGIWQGVEFDYAVTFTGPPDDLRGTATIDFASYQWRGRMTDREFKANFTGDRYTGGFDLKRVDPTVAARPPAPTR